MDERKTMFSGIQPSGDLTLGSYMGAIRNWVDMIDDYNNLFLMWHKDMDPALFRYACDVLVRHGASVPSLANYDLLVDCELRSGVDPDIAWTVSVSGCQWFCIPGREYCDQDVNALVLLDPMWRAIDRAITENAGDFEAFYRLFEAEFRRTVEAIACSRWVLPTPLTP